MTYETALALSECAFGFDGGILLTILCYEITKALRATGRLPTEAQRAAAVLSRAGHEAMQARQRATHAQLRKELEREPRGL